MLLRSCELLQAQARAEGSTEGMYGMEGPPPHFTKAPAESSILGRYQGGRYQLNHYYEGSVHICIFSNTYTCIVS